MSELSINPGIEIRDSERELQRFRWRLVLLGGFVLLLFGLLFLRFFYLQVVQHGHYSTLAEANRISVLPVAPHRGVIFDRNGVLLAHNYSAYTLEITPTRAGDLETTIDELATIVEITPRDRRRFRKLLEESKRFESLPIRTRLSDEEIARFAVHRYRFPGVEAKARLFRQYPQGEIFSHVVGHIGRINQREVEQLEKSGRLANYRGSDYIGKTGLEQSYEAALHGTTGIEEVEVDSGGRAVRVLSRTPPVPGNNLVLNLDAQLQEIAYQAFGNRRGALVAIDPRNGGVLALVSKPGFDPNLFVDGIDPQSWSELNGSPDKPLLNRAAAGTYPPGSTFKPFMALAALFYGKRAPQQIISDPGFFMFGGHRFRDGRPVPLGAVDMHRSIVVSSDVYYYTLANELGIDPIAKFMALFGFGSRTGIDIAGESAGVLPSTEWKLRRLKQKWYAGETISVGIGQGYNSYTPLQLASATATLANDGVMYRPHIVNYVENIRSGEKTPVEPNPLRDLTLKPEHLKVVKDAMVGVNKEGTSARVFADAPYVAAGKTGTAQVIAIKQGEKYVESRVAERHRDHSLFIAYAPADNPTIALAVIAENSGFGARAAAPIARQVLDYHILGKLPAKPAVTD
ncbi:MAG: penicillin-binding protein 2 [Burkholderiales bacterium]|nr:penicillin-binding protein 2 [Burkholderiales bacterium]MDP2399676.1 penicillin-binding protein 2 [Burkholderiales bacterium]